LPADQAAKAAIRDRVWTALEASGVSAAAHGRIPNFVGSDRAAERLAELPQWHQARTVKANPDHAQQAARQHALRLGKLLFMAVPKLAQPQPFYRLNPSELTEPLEQLADRNRAAEVAPTVPLESLPPIDFIICGSVAVNYDGVRVGKGAGYTDIEVALLAGAGLLKPDTTIVTTVHEQQVLDEALPHQPHDFTVDYIVTPERVVRCGPKHRPSGVDWQVLTPELLHSVPVLQALAAQHPAE
jgi:5-formyltetrahydrofolate cyclo-ligase